MKQISSRHDALKGAAPILLFALALAACTGQHNAGSDSGAPTAASTTIASPTSSANIAGMQQVVARFGVRLKQVSTLAPLDDLRQAVRRNYADLVTSRLLQAWLADPRGAPGRSVSSPWPRGIKIAHVRCEAANRCEMQGEVQYVTSDEVEHGGVFATRSINIELQNVSGRWLISNVRMGKLRVAQMPVEGSAR